MNGVRRRQVLAGAEASRRRKAVAADDFPSSRWSEHVSVTGKVKFFNETKGYLALEPGRLQHLYQASYLFGVAGIGLRLPASAVAQN